MTPCLVRHTIFLSEGWGIKGWNSTQPTAIMPMKKDDNMATSATYVNIPCAFLRNPLIPAEAKAVYCTLASYQARKEAYPTLEEISAQSGLSAARFRSQIKLLENLGYVKTSKRRSKAGILTGNDYELKEPKNEITEISNEAKEVAQALAEIAINTNKLGSLLEAAVQSALDLGYTKDEIIGAYGLYREEYLKSGKAAAYAINLPNWLARANGLAFYADRYRLDQQDKIEEEQRKTAAKKNWMQAHDVEYRCLIEKAISIENSFDEPPTSEQKKAYEQALANVDKYFVDHAGEI